MRIDYSYQQTKAAIHNYPINRKGEGSVMYFKPVEAGSGTLVSISGNLELSVFVSSNCIRLVMSKTNADDVK